MIKRLPRRASLSKTFAAGVVVALAFTAACGGSGKSSGSPSATSWTRGAPIPAPPSSPKEAVEAAVFRDFQWSEDCSVLGSCSATYRASDVACYPTGENLRATPVYWCSIGYGDKPGQHGRVCQPGRWRPCHVRPCNSAGVQSVRGQSSGQWVLHAGIRHPSVKSPVSDLPAKGSRPLAPRRQVPRRLARIHAG
jgi:hypothetical protein